MFSWCVYCFCGCCFLLKFHLDSKAIWPPCHENKIKEIFARNSSLVLLGCPSGGYYLRHNALMMHCNVRHLVSSLGSAQILASQPDCSTLLASTPSLFTPWIYTSALIILFTARSASFNITNLVGPEERGRRPSLSPCPFTFWKNLKFGCFMSKLCIACAARDIYVCRFSSPERTQRGRGYQAETLAT